MNNNETGELPQPMEVMLTDIHVRPEDFQFRECAYDNYHADELKKAIEQGRDVGPLDVWQDPADGCLYVLDGHHRYEAFCRLKWSRAIKVQRHEGEFHQVRLIALRENTKARLPMTATERSNAAWRLTCERHDDTYRYSKREIRECTGVADGTIATMRRTYKTLVAADKDIPDGWTAALVAAKGRDTTNMTDEDRDAMIKAIADEMDRQFGKAIGVAAQRSPEALQLVLERRMGKEFDLMVEAYSPPSDEEDELLF